MTPSSSLLSRLIQVMTPALTSRVTRTALGLTPKRPLRADYGELLRAVSSKIATAKWNRPRSFDEDDCVAVYWYTMDSLPHSPLTYGALNTLLRTGQHPQAADLWILGAYLYEALSKLPQRRDGLSFRVAKRFPGFEKIYRPGAVVREAAFVSSSRNPRPPFEGGIYFSILGRRGRLLGPLTYFGKEDEVLFLAGTSFKVVYVEPLSDGSVHIHMEEQQ